MILLSIEFTEFRVTEIQSQQQCTRLPSSPNARYSPRIMSLRLAVATEDLRSSLKKAIGAAATLEVQGVRLNTRNELDVLQATDSAVRQTLLYVKERQMRVAGLYCPTRHALYDSEYLEPRIEVIRQSMKLAQKLNTSELLVRCGRLPDPPGNDRETADPKTSEPDNPFAFETAAQAKPASIDRYSLLRQILNDLTEYGNHVGCVLNLLLSGYDRRQIAQLIADISGGPLKITFDPATAVMTGTNVTQAYRDLYQYVGYVRARDALKDIDGAGTEVAVSDGIVDWVQFTPTLVEADYQGWVCVERSGGDNRSEDVRRGVTYLKELMPQTSP